MLSQPWALDGLRLDSATKTSDSSIMVWFVGAGISSVGERTKSLTVNVELKKLLNALTLSIESEAEEELYTKHWGLAKNLER